MENKNFEKTLTNNAPKELSYSEKILWSNTWNSCLDRTNAKGIYEKAKELLIRIDYLNEIHDIKLPDSVAELAGELQTELKKAEQ